MDVTDSLLRSFRGWVDSILPRCYNPPTDLTVSEQFLIDEACEESTSSAIHFSDPQPLTDPLIEEQWVTPEIIGYAEK